MPIVSGSTTNLVIQQEGPIVVQLVTQPMAVQVQNGIPVQNLFVGPTAPAFIMPGMWVQTGLGDGSDFTIWIEDGS